MRYGYEQECSAIRFAVFFSGFLVLISLGSVLLHISQELRCDRIKGGESLLDENRKDVDERQKGWDLNWVILPWLGKHGRRWV